MFAINLENLKKLSLSIVYSKYLKKKNQLKY